VAHKFGDINRVEIDSQQTYAGIDGRQT
jgi:hypothetical protein